MTMETATRTPIQQKREQLKSLSVQVKDAVEAGKFTRVNEAIIETFYRSETHKEFKTFWQWVDAGFRVKKGEKAFCVWAKPMSAQAAARGEALPEDEHDFYPLCFLFSNAQVEPMKHPTRK